MRLLKGKDVADALVAGIKAKLDAAADAKPCLTIIRVGNRPDDMAYERGASKRMNALGIQCRVEILPGDIQQQEFMQAFQAINDDPSVHGILLLRPLPPQLDIAAVEMTIRPEKDVDCISPMNTAKIYLGDESGYAPCTAEAVMAIIDSTGMELQGKKVVIVGCGKVVGKPLAVLMMQRNATVTSCNEFTIDLAVECQGADVIVSCAGVCRLIKENCVSPDCIVIDVGINTDANGKLCGDVDFEAVAPIVKGITPVPGGVGSVTTTILAAHVAQAVSRLA